MLPDQEPAAAEPLQRRLALWLLVALALTAALVWFSWRLPRVLPPPPGPAPFTTLHPHTQRVLVQLGIKPERVAQGLGLASASAGIHSADGLVSGRPYCAAFDLSVSDLTPPQTRALLHRLRRAGIVCWWRVPGVNFPEAASDGTETGPHIHGVDPFIPHKRRLEQQIRSYVSGGNGLEVGQYAHRPDPPETGPPTPQERKLLFRETGQWQLRQAKPSVPDSLEPE